MNLPADKLCCLAHEHDRAIIPLNKYVPPPYCTRLAECVRHQAIGQTPYNGQFTVKARVCQLGQHDQFIARDAVESEGGEA